MKNEQKPVDTVYTVPGCVGTHGAFTPLERKII